MRASVNWIFASAPTVSPSEPPVRVVTSSPLGPLVPVGPVGPAAPIYPVGPVFPVGPAAPVTPCAPSGPVRPTDPIGPWRPAAPTAPCEPVGPAAPFGPVGPVGPCSPWEPAAPGRFQSNPMLCFSHGLSVPTILPFRDMQSEISCGFAAGEILAINIAAADAPTSQRHAFL